MAQTQQRPEMDEGLGYDKPHITGRTPESVRPGDTLTLSGAYLQPANKCTFQVGQTTLPGDIVQRSGDDVKVRVPNGLPAGNGKVWLTSSSGEGNHYGFIVES